MKPKALLFWSSGKDSAWTLHVLRQQNEFEVVALATTFTEAFNRVAMHAVRRELVEMQADAAGLPLWPVMLPWPCSNIEYEVRLSALLDIARQNGIQHVAFGDLFLEDIRVYRERQLAASRLTPLFPLWTDATQTPALARTMLDTGIGAVLTCVDPKQMNADFIGRQFDQTLLSELPTTVDPCGERGEFHTFCHSGPVFRRAIAIRVGERVEREGFVFADVQSA
jgi:uncharacterized protein (TIGR00290 family)